MSGIGNEVQMRVVAEAVAEAAVRKHALENPPPTVKTEIPALVKWLAGAIGALGTAAMIGVCFWVVTTLSALQQTVTRIDERQQMTGPEVTKRLDKMDERLTRLEHRNPAP